MNDSPVICMLQHRIHLLITNIRIIMSIILNYNFFLDYSVSGSCFQNYRFVSTSIPTPSPHRYGSWDLINVSMRAAWPNLHITAGCRTLFVNHDVMFPKVSSRLVAEPHLHRILPLICILMLCVTQAASPPILHNCKLLDKNSMWAQLIYIIADYCIQTIRRSIQMKLVSEESRKNR